MCRKIIKDIVDKRKQKKQINCFLNFKYNSNVINIIAGSVLGVYLMHDNKLMREIIWTKISPNVDYLHFPYFHSIIKVVLIFVVFAMIDILFECIIFKRIKKLFNK